MAYNSVRNRYVEDGAGVVPPPRLLVMLYERLILDLEQADAALSNGALSVVNDKLLHAQAIVLELHSALDVDSWEGAANIAQLYTWFSDELVQANVKKDAAPIRSCLTMIRQLSEAWHEAYESMLGGTQPAATPASIAALKS